MLHIIVHGGKHNVLAKRGRRATEEFVRIPFRVVQDTEAQTIKFVLRGARGAMVRSTMPHGSNRITALLSLRISGSLGLELAPAVGALVARYH